MSRWPESLSALIEQGKTSVLITIVEAKGSVPRGAGTKMIVTERGIHFGTIGGGNLEYQCIQKAQQRLKNKSPVSNDHWLREVQQFSLGASLGQCCGGRVVVLFEYIPAVQPEWLSRLLEHKAGRKAVFLVTSLKDALSPKQVTIIQSLKQPSEAKNELKTTHDFLVETVEASRFNIVVFGAGHVGRALVHILAGLECEVHWVDSRVAEFPETVADNVTKIVEPQPTDFVADAPEKSYYIILTHSHDLDLQLCESVLRRGDFQLCGLIGSQSKRMKFEHRLKAKGFTKQAIDQLTCPIGIDGISGKQPGQIAVAVAAQLLRLQEINLGCS